ncbi:unnamed protein product [Adineta steineri]|uniref:Uncharacterized protein n=1 Tax=Adineta steineri TaxID=433720 RepID=A0A813V616_9BILA|nr:unnamed protein product [Adineta steineri]CAF3837409.1 unnamed protein product [Adineta steineri]
MHTICIKIVFPLLYFISVAMGHARMKYPRPLAAPADSPAGNYYNAPLRPDGSEFPCKNLHKKADVNKNPTETWQPGQQARFEILGHGSSGEGSLAAHSGGSCQASLSFDNGETWKVLHTFIGGCPRGVRRGTNIAGPKQTFPFMVPENTKAGNALFSWSWIAVTGNRNEMYQNCAVVAIAGSGTSTLNHLPDMFVGDLTLPGQIGAGECRSSSGFAIEFPNPGEAKTITEFDNIGFKKPTGGKCFAKASTNNSTAQTTSTSSLTTKSSSSASVSTTNKATTKVSTSTISTKASPSTTSTKASPSTASTTPAALKVSTTALPNGQLPAQCSKYMSITDASRRTIAASHIGCDKSIFSATPTWVRFSGGAGTRIVSGATEPFRCGTQGAGWYKGIYPSAVGATSEGTVCYSWPGNTCQWSNTISITNCKDYYVFALRAPPACYLRYCTI